MSYDLNKLRRSVSQDISEDVFRDHPFIRETYIKIPEHQAILCLDDDLKPFLVWGQVKIRQKAFVGDNGEILSNKPEIILIPAFTESIGIEEYVNKLAKHI